MKLLRTLGILPAAIFMVLSCQKETQAPLTQKVYFPEEHSLSGDAGTIFEGERLLATLHLQGSEMSYYPAFEQLSQDSYNKNVHVWVFEDALPSDWASFQEETDIIVLINPDITKLSDWAVKAELDMDFTPYENYALVAFDQRGDICTLTGFNDDDPLGCLNGFVHWVNQCAPDLNDDLTAEDPDPGYSEYDALFQKTHGSHSIPFFVKDFVFAQVACSNEDKRSGWGVVDFQWRVRPLHGYNDSVSYGDLYAVCMETSIHSGDMYERNNYDITHGGVHVRNRGFYAKCARVNAAICKNTAPRSSFKLSNLEPVGFFEQSPKPETVIGKTTYTKGITAYLGGSLTGGFSDKGVDLKAIFDAGLKLGTGSIKQVSDIEINNNAYPQISSYDIKYPNGPHMDNAKIWITEPTPVSVSNFTLFQEFLLHIQEKTDNSTERHYMRLDLKTLEYGICRFYTTCADFKEFILGIDNFKSIIKGKKGSADREVKLSDVTSAAYQLPVPNRTPLGNVSITHDYRDLSYVVAMEFVNVRDKKKTFKYTQPVLTYGDEFKRAIPEGTYKVNVWMGEDQASAKKCTSVSDVTIRHGEPVILYTGANFKIPEGE